MVGHGPLQPHQPLLHRLQLAQQGVLPGGGRGLVSPEGLRHAGAQGEQGEEEGREEGRSMGEGMGQEHCHGATASCSPVLTSLGPPDATCSATH